MYFFNVNFPNVESYVWSDVECISWLWQSSGS